jgi:hypothetical protein
MSTWQFVKPHESVEIGTYWSIISNPSSSHHITKRKCNTYVDVTPVIKKYERCSWIQGIHTSPNLLIAH